MRQALVRYRSVVADSARWEGFEFRDDDIVISTPWKSGTTWTQMIVSLLVFQTADTGQHLDFLSPWVDIQLDSKEGVFAHLEAQRHRRFIKSHTPLDGLPLDERVTYITTARDPRDIGFSWGNHMANIDFDAFFAARERAVGVEDVPELLPGGPPVIPESEIERFWMWAMDPTPLPLALGSMAQTIHHLYTFWEMRERPNVLLLHYHDLKTDLGGQMRALAQRLGIEVEESRWPELVEAATFARMKEKADVLAPEVENKVWRDNQRFFNRGTSGQWRDFLSGDDLRRYEARLKELAGDEEFVKWLHEGGPTG